MNTINAVTARAFGKSEAKARREIVRTADRTDGSAETARRALIAVGEAEKLWDRLNFNRLSDDDLNLVAGGMDPCDPSKSLTEKFGWGFTAEMEVFRAVAKRVADAD